MSKVAIVCAFDTYFDRVRMLRTYFKHKGDRIGKNRRSSIIRVPII